MAEVDVGRLRLCIDAEIARARLEHLIAESDDVTVLWLSGIVRAAVGGPSHPVTALHLKAARQ